MTWEERVRGISGTPKGLRDMKNKNQFIEGGWRFNQKGEEVISVMTLVYAEGPRKKQVAERGDIVTSGGETWTLTGARAPHKPSSTGRIYVKGEGDGMTREFFPSVCGLAWKPLSRRSCRAWNAQQRSLGDGEHA